MLASGNGEPTACVMNLLRTVRGEVPFERIKGIDRELIDSPSTEIGEIANEIEWLIETFEPRIEDGDIEAMAQNAAEGEFWLYTEVEVTDGD